VKRARDGAEMVAVPRGAFRVGYEALPGEGPGDGPRLGPSRPVELTKSCYVDVSEVTVGAWRRFAAETGARVPPAALDAPDAVPVRGVTHDEATAYARWVGCTLPTEAQWERAARAGRAYALYPTDDHHDVPAHRNGEGAQDGFEGVAPIRSFPANAWGFFDLAGNVAEWCADGYAPFLETNEVARDPVGPPDAPTHVVKGGSWRARGPALSVGRREGRGEARDDVGFRCARALP
jgi:formylglycine-generating enzyme required for sulfatase activity